jgi:uncharacterized membrane protein YpjA
VLNGKLAKQITELLFLFKSGRRKLILFLIISNFLGSVYGWYYYRYQLAESQIVFWPLITDCPNASLFFTISAVLIVLNLRNDAFLFFSSTNMLKYGIWTMTILIFHRDFFFAPERLLLYSGIFVTHFIIFIESFLISAEIEKVSPQAIMISTAWFLLNDFSDYFLNTHPYIPEKSVELIAVFTFILSFTSIYAVMKINEFLRMLRV